jgi:hypothetical protein
MAEGNGQDAAADRCRDFDLARGSAWECAACLDVLVARNRLDPADTGTRGSEATDSEYGGEYEYD